MLLSVACALMLYGPVALPVPAPQPATAAGPASVAPWPAHAPDLMPPVRTAAVVVACAVMLAAAGWFWRRAQLRGVGLGRERIDLLASRSFGPKHRVAVIETCGERLLLALCDKEISVLSHLPCGPATHDQALPSTADAAPKAAAAERRFEVVP